MTVGDRSANQAVPGQEQPGKLHLPKPVRVALGFVIVLLVIGILSAQLELSFPSGAPALSQTETPRSQPTPQALDSYDVLGRAVTASEARELLQTETGQQFLAPENGAIAITPELFEIGRKAFYTETFGNEYFFTDVVGAIAGPINLVTMAKAIAALGGKPTTNLQVPLEETVTIGGRTFAQGTLLDTGLDVPKGGLLPLGMQTLVKGGKLRVGITCAACHAAVDPETGLIREGAPNIDLDTGLLQAFATNSAAMFRQTGINPISTTLPKGNQTYIDASGQAALLPDPQALENAVDAQLLAWMPGNFDSTLDNRNNPSQNPSSYTYDSYPYGWSGFASVGWFHGLTTLNNNVHATNSDPTTGADSSQALLGIDKETYLGVMLQNAANPKFRLPAGVRPSKFFDSIDPTPGEPGMNQVIRMPNYPKGSIFVLDGLMANSPGARVGQELNGLSVYQNSLAPPPYEAADRDTLQRGSAIFNQAGCAVCHSGRFFTNHDVIPVAEIKTQPSRASALAQLPKIFVRPQTYPSTVRVPLPANPPVLAVPLDITPEKVRNLAYAIDDPAGGYKVPNLIGLAVTAPYLHDGGVAAGPKALELDQGGRYRIANSDGLGPAGTVIQHIAPDPEASLRVLVDRTLRQAVVTANQHHPDLQTTNVDGRGHLYWVDAEAGFSTDDQTDLIQFLLSLDDAPAVLPGF